MLRSTSPALVVFQNAYLPRILGKITPERMELTMIILKERKKRVRYLGSNFLGFNDRALMYAAQGGVRRGSRFIIDTHHTRLQFIHPAKNNDLVDIRSIKTAGAQYDSMGNYTRMTWDHGICSTNLLNDPSLKRQFKNVHKEQAIQMLEEWGVRYVVLDEIRKPSLMDCKYHKHHLYADKFSWSPDPETNHLHGDAEYKWKGDELIAYADYNAHTPHPANFGPSGGDGRGAATTTSDMQTQPSPWFRRTLAATSRGHATAPATTNRKTRATAAPRTSPAAAPKISPAAAPKAPPANAPKSSPAAAPKSATTAPKTPTDGGKMSGGDKSP